MFFGEKVRGTGPLAEHFFHSRSPIAFVPADIPQKAVYLCVQREYTDRSQQALAEFRKEVLDYKAGLVQAGTLLSALSPQEVQQLFAAVNAIVDKRLGQMMDMVQLEGGSYRFSVSARYRASASSQDREKSSTVTFTVANDVKDLLRSSLRNMLFRTAGNLVLDQQLTVEYPEYNPTKVTEVS